MAKVWIILIVIFSTFGNFLPGPIANAHGLEVEETNMAFLQNLNPSERIAQIKTKTETLMQSSMKLGEAMYKAQSEAAAAAVFVFVFGLLQSQMPKE